MKLKALRKSLCVLLTVMMLFTLAPITVSAASFKLSKTSVSLTKGYSTTLKVTGTSKKVTWSSSNKKVATVTSKGKVYGKKAGTCYITAKVGKESVKCKVSVVNGKLTLSRSTLYIEEGDSEVITVKALGSHSLKLSHSNKSIASASWSGEWDGNDHDITVSAKKAGKATIKVIMSKYTSIYKTITVNVSAAEQEVDNSSGETTTPSTSKNDKTTTILSDRTLIYLNKGETATVNFYTDNPSKVTIKSSDTSVVKISDPKWDSQNKTSITFTGVKGGRATVTAEASDNPLVKRTVNVEVLSDGYYEISNTIPSKKISTDTVLQWTDNGITKYMLAPYGYDIAHTNSVFAKAAGKAQYYQIYEENPVKIDSRDVVSSFNYTTNGKKVVRYVLLPASYDTVRYNTLTAQYIGKYNYWVIYNVSPTKNASDDTIRQWQASVDGVLYTRYILLPKGYSESQLDAVMKDDKNINSAYYAVSLATPVKQADTDSIYTFSVNGSTAYILLPGDYDTAKRDTAIAKYTGVYEYYVIYTEKPALSMSTDIVKDWKKNIGGKSETRYMLLPAGYSVDYFNSIVTDDMGAADIYYTVSSQQPNKIQSGDIIWTWYNPSSRTTKYMLLPDSYDALKRNDIILADTGSYDYYMAYSKRPVIAETSTDRVFSYSSNKGTIYVVVPKDYDESRLNAAVDEVNKS